MKIDNPNLSGAGAAGLGKANLEKTTDKHARQGGASSQSEAQDSVQLSGLGTKIRELSGETPERAAMVQRLEQQVMNGQYHPDSKAVSKGIVNDALHSGRDAKT